jgi:hypothetical protein
MKTIKKETVWILFVITTILFNSNIISAQIEQPIDFITVNGTVRDAKSRRILEYVNVSVPGTNIGTITNTDGVFSIKVPTIRKDAVLEISHIGYLSAHIQLEGEDISNLTVQLTPNTNMLEEIIIRAQDPVYLVEEAISRITTNYSNKHGMLTGFYRETAQKGRNYISIAEAIVDIYKTPYHQSINQDRVQIYKGRQLLSQKRSDTLGVKLQGGPNLAIFLDVAKNRDFLFNRNELHFYSFRMEEPVMINDRQQYVISFQPQVVIDYALYRGKLFIDKESMTFTRAEIQLDLSDINKATDAILRKKPSGLRFRPMEISYLVNYKQQDGRATLNYIRYEAKFRCDWRRRLFHTNYSIVSEMVITDIREENVTSIPYRASFKSNQSFSDKVSDFIDDNFWGEYNIIEPTESLESAVNRLRRQQQ